MPRTLTYAYINNKTFTQLYTFLLCVFSTTHAISFVHCRSSQSVETYYRKYAKTLASALVEMLKDYNSIFPINLVVLNSHTSTHRSLHLCGPINYTSENIPFLPFHNQKWSIQRLSEMEIKLRRKK
jgi:hypothetical protein